MMEFQKGQIRNDFRIRENQRFVEHPPFAGGEEEHYARFRRWSRQFYLGEDGATAPSRTIEASA
jgi:3-ketosteroid 9alpha-monooxygenase subunit A